MRGRLFWGTAVALSVASAALVRATGPVAPVTADEAAEIAIEAYVYAFPLVIMDVSRAVMTNFEAADMKAGMGSPANQFRHKRTFPDASFTDVVRPNADTLYSSLWFDVSDEPLVIDVPDSAGRYYLLPMMDMWTDIFASPGKRTTGTGPQTFAIVGPGWQGDLPGGVTAYRSPTAQGWMIGRTQTNGPADFANVHKFQDGLKATPLSAWGKNLPPAKGYVDPSISQAPPVEQVAQMDAATFFGRFLKVMEKNPPHANDYPVLARMERIGLAPGQPFDMSRLSPEAQSAIERAPKAAFARLAKFEPHAAPMTNGWAMMANPIGTYGTDYLKRTLVAYMGLGANTIEDAIYPTARVQADGKLFDSNARYQLHFAKDQVPPVRAFWSLTMYNERQFFAANPIHRYAIGDRDQLKFNSDGSLDLYIQRESPGADKEPNWLPAPAEGSFTMNLRLYWPTAAALDGTWAPPVIERVR